jgi:hypothetical protein
MSTTELWTAVLLGALIIALLVAVFVASRFPSRETGHGSAHTYALAFAGLAFASVWMTWSSGTWWSALGVENTAGIVTLIVASCGIVAAGLAVRRGISSKLLAVWESAVALVMFGAPMWFLLTTVGDPDHAYEDTLIDCFSDSGICNRIDAGVGLMLAIAAGAGYLVAVALRLTFGHKGDTQPGTNLRSMVRRLIPGELASGD